MILWYLADHPHLCKNVRANCNLHCSRGGRERQESIDIILTFGYNDVGVKSLLTPNDANEKYRFELLRSKLLPAILHHIINVLWNATLQFNRAIRKAFCRRLYRHFVALGCFQCVCKTHCSYSWCFFYAFMQADFHARQKNAHKNAWVNWNLQNKDVIVA